MWNYFYTLTHIYTMEENRYVKNFSLIFLLRPRLLASNACLHTTHSAEKVREGILLLVRKFLVSKSFMDEKGGITFFRRKSLISRCRKKSWASLQCFGKIGSSKNFMHNRGYHSFPSKISCLTVPKTFVKKPFNASLNSDIKKCLG